MREKKVREANMRRGFGRETHSAHIRVSVFCSMKKASEEEKKMGKNG